MPKSAAVSAALAEVKSIQGDSAAAQRFAQDALKKNPDYAPAMIALARDHYRARRLDLALYTLRAILDGYGPENPPRDKNNAEAHLLRGLIPQLLLVVHAGHKGIRLRPRHRRPLHPKRTRVEPRLSRVPACPTNRRAKARRSVPR